MSCFGCNEPPIQLRCDNSNSCNSECNDSNCCFPWFRVRQRNRQQDQSFKLEEINNVALEALDKDSKKT